MSRLIDQVGLTDGVGLTDRAGLYKFGTFDPLRLNPYLLFDAATSMIGTLENPTLDLDPANPETLDVITATRAGIATYTDPDGNIATASADTVRVDYTQGAELTPAKFQNVVQTDYSASPNVIGPRVTLSDISGPDGESGGVRVTETVNNTQHYLAVRTQEIVSGTTYTVSFYVKEGAYSSVVFYTQSAKVNSYVSINFSTGNATFSGPDLVSNSGSFTSVGDGWYRVVYSATAQSSGEMDLYVCSKDLSAYAGDVNNFTDYYGFQVEEGTTASDFVANTTGSPKFITGATYGPRVPMILVEPAATNYWRYSDLSNQIISGDTFTTNYADSPLGSDTASQLKSSGPTSSNSNIRFRTNSFTVASGETTISILAKADTRSKIYMHIEGFDGSNRGARFDLFAGSVYQNDTGITSTIEPISGGWYRVSMTFTTTTDLNGDVRVYIQNDSWVNHYVLDGTESVLFAGLQVESGSVATSYIPTSGSTVTRAADDLVISGSAFTDFYNGSEGTFYAESVTDSALGARYIFQASSSTGNPYSNRHTVYYSDHQNLQRVGVVSTKDNASQFSAFPSSSQFTVGTLTRSAFSYKTGDFRFSTDGGAELTPSGLKVPSPTINQIHLGASHAGTVSMNGHIKRLIYWPLHSDSL